MYTPSSGGGANGSLLNGFQDGVYSGARDTSVTRRRTYGHTGDARADAGGLQTGDFHGERPDRVSSRRVGRRCNIERDRGEHFGNAVLHAKDPPRSGRCSPFRPDNRCPYATVAGGGGDSFDPPLDTALLRVDATGASFGGRGNRAALGGPVALAQGRTDPMSPSAKLSARRARAASCPPPQSVNRRHQAKPLEDTKWVTGGSAHLIAPSPRSIRPERSTLMETPWAEAYPPPRGGETPQRAAAMAHNTIGRRPSPYERRSNGPAATERSVLTLDGVAEPPSEGGRRAILRDDECGQLSGSAAIPSPRPRSASEPRMRHAQCFLETRQGGRKPAGRYGNPTGKAKEDGPFPHKVQAPDAESSRNAGDLFLHGLCPAAQSERREHGQRRREGQHRTPRPCLSGTGVTLVPTAGQVHDAERKHITSVRRYRDGTRRDKPWGVDAPTDWASVQRLRQRQERHSVARPNFWQNRLKSTRGRGPHMEGELWGGSAPSARRSSARRGGRAPASVGHRVRAASLAGSTWEMGAARRAAVQWT